MEIQQAFKLGFLRQCAVRGLTPEEIDELLDDPQLVKRAGWAETLTAPLTGAAETMKSWLPIAAPTAVGGALGGGGGAVAAGTAATAVQHPGAILGLLGAAAAGGGALGYGAGRVVDALDEQHPDEIRKRDVINRYNLAAQRLRQQNALAERIRQTAGRKAHWRA